MEFFFTALSQTVFNYEEGDKSSELKSCSVSLEVSKNLNESKYVDKNGRQHEGGIKPITVALIHGLLSNVKHAHAKGWWKEAEHIKYIFEELQRGFADVAYSDPEIVEGELRT